MYYGLTSIYGKTKELNAWEIAIVSSLNLRIEGMGFDETASDSPTARYQCVETPSCIRLIDKRTREPLARHHRDERGARRYESDPRNNTGDASR